MIGLGVVCLILALSLIGSFLSNQRLEKELDTMEYILEIKDNQILEMEDSIRKKDAKIVQFEESMRRFNELFK